MTTKKAILLVNLGSPDSTSIPDIKKYLAEFLMDKYVIDLPWPLRAAIVYGPILTFRPKKTAAAYNSVWTKSGSPLIQISKGLQKKVQEKLDNPVYLAMRYGNPSIPDVINTIKKENPKLESLFVIPLYPQYAMSTTLTVEKAVEKAVQETGLTAEVTFKDAFYNDPSYIASLVQSARKQLNNAEHILFSYHGLPERHLRKTDAGNHCTTQDCCNRPSDAWKTCYKHQAKITSELFMQVLGKDISYSIAFQSRLGPDKWISPSTEDEIIRLGESGVKNIHVICPSFVADCLETLEEINMEGRETFLEHGGESFTYIPCVNTTEDWINTVVKWCK
jgi:ferrochelatase